MAATPKPESPRIRRLQRALRVKRKSAEARFLRSLARSGTPIVEPVPGDPTRSWVTYVWRGAASTHAVGVSSPQTEFGKFDPLSRLPGSQLWYRTVKVKNDCMGAYCLIPNLPSKLPDDLDGYLRLLKRGKPDPLNPERFVSPRDPEFPDHPVYGATYSALHLKAAPKHAEVTRHAGTPAGTVKLRHLRSRVLKNKRRVWVYTPPGPRGKDADAHLMIFFDGFGYVHEISAPIILDNLAGKGRIPPTYALFVDALDMGTRGRELPCNPDFGAFLIKELLPWSRRVLGRSFDGRLLPFKKGPFYLAEACQAPVVPVTIAGTHYVMPKRRYAIKPGKVDVIFHDPIEPADFGSRECLMEKVRRAIDSGLPVELQEASSPEALGSAGTQLQEGAASA